nr:Rho GTPase-activating protein 7-like isoform X2 [Tanacetum cinerariifolium]
VSRLQEQLQAERDLRAALEVGLSMSSGHGSGSNRTMDSKTRAELEEIALAEADVARLKQKVAEKFVQQDFDTSLAFINHERKQRTE